ncbi:Phosphatidylinositol-4-phosphate 5-kinase, core [Dillenia turbinata]|uniref:1-phosphatidylinositol-3-phosphate 5-kinase n=1 Tax=Dillenia turbinata TaxID=194707 RepID=A0AAN8VNM0_9MAGN
MGIPDNSFLDLIEKVRSWISWGERDFSGLSTEYQVPSNTCKMCSICNMSFTEFCIRYQCKSCSRVFCENCTRKNGSFRLYGMKSSVESVENLISCKFCSGRNEAGRRYSEKIYPSLSPPQSPEVERSCLSGEAFERSHNSKQIQRDQLACYLEARGFGLPPSAVNDGSAASSTGHPSPVSVRHSSSRSDEEDEEDAGSHFFSPSSVYCHYMSDTDTGSFSAGHEFYSFKSLDPSPLDSPSRIDIASDRIGHPVQQDHDRSPKSQCYGDFDQNTIPVLRRFEKETEDPDNTDNCADDLSIFGYKEPLRAVVQGHFRALVSQLLQGEGIKVGNENGFEEWLDIVTKVAWQAANFVKPDTSKGGSMDPGDYVKIKCIASGSRGESTFIKGVVCTKNIKHKRMTSQYKNPKLLLLGGALEYQRVPNQLASFDTLLQQEIDHLKMIVSKIEAHRPNVLLVEKSVSSYAQEYFLAKEISLVLNVKRPLLQRIARCTGAQIAPSIDNISAARLGHCELFHLERVSEELETANHSGKKSSKTLMYFEGCPRRLGCTVLLKGACRDELKKVKHVVQYAVFAAYHLSLETSFLADEGASLPKMTLRPSITIPERIATESSISIISHPTTPVHQALPDGMNRYEGSVGLTSKLGRWMPSELVDSAHNLAFPPDENNFASAIPESCSCKDLSELSDVGNASIVRILETGPQEKYPARAERIDEGEVSSDYFSAADSHQSILVSFSSHCMTKETECVRSRLMRIKFYGCSDKPLGRYLHDDLFDQTSYCQSCKEPIEAHVQCYTHQQGSLTINVKRLPSLKLPGERDGKIWMWHRCLRCAYIDGVPPATRRVVMSDAAWGLSFGKFLELSFSNHAAANRVASCGHSLQRDCLRYYGFGNMVAFFRYSPIDILSVRLPPPMLEFSGHSQEEWVKRETAEVTRVMESLYLEIFEVLQSMEQKSTSGNEPSDATDLHVHIRELKEVLSKERADYRGFLQSPGVESSQSGQMAVDILELNCLRRSLLIGSYVWDWRLYSLDSLLKTRSSSLKAIRDSAINELKECKSGVLLKSEKVELIQEENSSGDAKAPSNGLQTELVKPHLPAAELCVPKDCMLNPGSHYRPEETHSDSEVTADKASLENNLSSVSNLSEKIDSAWTGFEKTQLFQSPQVDAPDANSVKHIDNPSFRRIMSPMRVYSFDSATRAQEKIRKGFPSPSLHLSTHRSFHSSGDYRNMVRDPVSDVLRTYSQISPREAQKLSFILSSTPVFISSASHITDGARLLLPQTGHNDVVVAIYDTEPTSIISYALTSKEYMEWVADKLIEHEGVWNPGGPNAEDSAGSTYTPWQSFGSLDVDYIHYGSYGSEESSSTVGSLFMDPKKSPHLRISFGDESSIARAKVKFSVTCYFAKQFDSLRKKCCPSELDFVRSLSRCRRWSAQGGKSNVYFAKSLDERFIIKQVTKTELESFEDFAPQYFKYLTDSLNSRGPTCLAKVLGIYQVTVKYLKGGGEMKMDLMVMENLFYKRRISRVYDLKGSSRARYNPDTTGTNKVLLDMNLLESLRTKPILLGSKAKRSLERAVWNDTSFLASVDVMDYSLLVGVDDESKELVLGIIDFMRQYTWDKHLETWVKASGILGGPKNASPTIISPKQYKKRFRKAMTTYFLTVSDRWSS